MATVTNVRIVDLIKLLVQFIYKRHVYVDIEFPEDPERPNTLLIYPARPPKKLDNAKENEKESNEPLDDDLIAKLL